MSKVPVDHSQVPVVGYTDRLSYSPGDIVTLCASAMTPDARMTLVRLGHDGHRATRSAVGDASFVSLPHEEVDLGSYGIVTWQLREGAYAFAAWILPTRWPSERAAIMSSESGECGNTLSIDSTGRLHLSSRDEDLSLSRVLHPNSWYFCVGGRTDGGRDFLALAPALPDSVSDRLHFAHGASIRGPAVHGPALTLGAQRCRGKIDAHFDGRVEAPCVLDAGLTPADVLLLARGGRSGDGATAPHQMLARWDGSLDRSTFVLRDVAGGHDISLVNAPTRNVPGRWWSGDIHDPRLAPEQYAAVHFHSDDQDGQGWQPVASLRLPDDLDSDVYGVELTLDSGGTDIVPFAVRRSPAQGRARLGVLLPTLTYLAYALEHAAPPDLPELVDEVSAPFARANGFHSWYDLHSDGSFVVFCSLNRPLLGIRPDHRFRYTGAEHGLSADLRLLGWLARHGFDYEVLTDHDLDDAPAATLEGLPCLVTGAHPEYWSARMLDGLESYLEEGGNLAYLGGNGFLWSVVVDHAHGRAEMRRGDIEERPYDSQTGLSHFQLTDGRSGLWQACGRPQARLVGVTPTAMGFTDGVPFRPTQGASEPAVARLFAGIDITAPLGTHSAVLGAAASYETDLASTSLGTPHDAVVVASAVLPDGYTTFAPAFHRAASGEDGHSRLRADMVYFETPAGGRVFAAGSIGWAGCLGTDEDDPAERLTDNLLSWFSEVT